MFAKFYKSYKVGCGSILKGWPVSAFWNWWHRKCGIVGLTQHSSFVASQITVSKLRQLGDNEHETGYYINV